MSKRINPYKMFYGAHIPEWLVERPISEVSMGAKITYARLTQYSGEKGVCKPKLETLAENIGVSLAQVKRYIEELKKLKLIESIRLGKKCSNRYYFLFHIWIEKSIYLNNDSSDMSLHSKSDSSDMSCPMESSDMSCPQKENQERESNISPKSKNRWEEFSSGFENKNKTGDCDQKLNRLSQDDWSLLISQRDAYFRFIKNKRKSWPDYPMKNASTFINKKYWKDAEWKTERPKDNFDYDGFTPGLF